MYDVAIGDLGLSLQEFERMGFGEFFTRYNGLTRQRKERLKELRLLMWSGMVMHSKRRLKPEDIINIDDKPRTQSRPASKEEFEDLKNRFKIVA